MTLALIITIAYVVGGFSALVLISLMRASNSDVDPSMPLHSAQTHSTPDHTNLMA